MALPLGELMDQAVCEILGFEIVQHSSRFLGSCADGHSSPPKGKSHIIENLRDEQLVFWCGKEEAQLRANIRETVRLDGNSTHVNRTGKGNEACDGQEECRLPRAVESEQGNSLRWSQAQAIYRNRRTRLISVVNEHIFAGKDLAHGKSVDAIGVKSNTRCEHQHTEDQKQPFLPGKAAVCLNDGGVSKLSHFHRAGNPFGFVKHPR